MYVRLRDNEGLRVTRLERLAAEIPLPADELRASLRRQINAVRCAQAPTLPTVWLLCSKCGGGFDVAHTSASAILRWGHPRCLDCRSHGRNVEPRAHEYRWVAALPAQEYARAMVAVAAMR